MARLRKQLGVPSTDLLGVPGVPTPPPAYQPPAVSGGVVKPSQGDPKNPPPIDPPITTENQPNGPEPGPGNSGPVPPPPPPIGFTRTAENNPGLDATKWLGGHLSPKYAWYEVGLQHDLTTEAGRAAALAQAQSQYGDWFGGASWEGDDWLNLGGAPNSAWNGVTGFDAVFDASGETGNTRPWMGNETFAPGFGREGSGAGAGAAPSPSQAPSGGYPDSPYNAETLEQLMASFGSLFGGQGQQYTPPGDSGVYPEDPLQQVGEDPLSELITGGMAALINTGGQGFSDTGKASNDALIEMLRGGRGGGMNEDIINARMESAREHAERWRKGQMDTLQAGLADRGLMGSGPERTGMERIGLEMEGIGATALRDIFADQTGSADERFMNAIKMGMDGSQANNRTLLDTLGAANNRQMGLSQVALASLAQNMEWNQFLAEFGLDRDRVMEEMQNGRIEAIMPLLQMFIQLAGQARGGYV